MNRLLTTSWGTTGLDAATGTGALHYTVYADDGTSLIARANTGIVESPAGSGEYRATRTDWSASWSGFIVWETGIAALFTGAAAGGSTTTVIKIGQAYDAANAARYVGATLFWTTPDPAQQARITAYADAGSGASLVTIDTPFTVAPSAGNTLQILPGVGAYAIEQFFAAEPTGLPRLILVDFGATGLDADTGDATLHYTVKDVSGTTLVARTNTGVTEFPAGSGIYQALLADWDWSLDGVIIWDAGGSGPGSTAVEQFTAQEASETTTYGTRAGIEGIYGVENVARLCCGGPRRNQDAGDIAEQIDRARQHAYDWINSKLRGAGLTAPATADNFTEFGLLDDIENERAGAWLYFKRGKNDNDPNGAAQMQWHWDNAPEALLDRVIGIAVQSSSSSAGGLAIAIAIPVTSLPRFV
jgi:hypothetical protein